MTFFYWLGRIAEIEENITISAGVAEWRDGESGEQLLPSRPATLNSFHSPANSTDGITTTASVT